MTTKQPEDNQGGFPTSSELRRDRDEMRRLPRRLEHSTTNVWWVVAAVVIVALLALILYLLMG